MVAFFSVGGAGFERGFGEGGGSLGLESNIAAIAETAYTVIVGGAAAAAAAQSKNRRSWRKRLCSHHVGSRSLVPKQCCLIALQINFVSLIVTS